LVPNVEKDERGAKTTIRPKVIAAEGKKAAADGRAGRWVVVSGLYCRVI